MIYYKKKIQQEKEQEDPKRVPLILTCNQLLSNLTAVVCKNWNILQTNKNLQELFQEHPVTVFKRNKNLKEIIVSTRIENCKVKTFNIPSKTHFCLSGKRTLCCNQVLTTNIFMNQQTKRTFNIFFNLNCKKVNTLFI